MISKRSVDDVTSGSTRKLNGFRVTVDHRGVDGSAGGDFFRFVVLGPGHIGVLIGDMCGFGREGESQLAPFLPSVRALASSWVSPARLLFELNRAAAAELPIDRFVTATALELDIRRARLAIANAGHVPAMIHRANGSVSIVGRSSGAPLGFSELSEYRLEAHALFEGDVVVLMTDGVLEAIESDLTQMCESRLLLSRTGQGARATRRQFLRRLDECAGRGHPDDITLVALEALRRPPVSNVNGISQVVT